MDLVTGETFVIDKPLGWTSFDAVKRLRGAVCRRLGVRKFKIGHAGTLDPLASGVLLVCTGRKTKEIDSLQAGEKEYIADVQFGATTPSFDLETEIDAVFPDSHISREALEEILPRFTGEIMQVPPVFSAVKIDGKRAYKYARKGREVEMKAKPLLITALEILDFDKEKKKASLRIVCSKGTYIRALARDLGEALGSGAHLAALKRTRVGAYALAEALSMNQALEKIASDPLDFPENCPPEYMRNAILLH